MFAYKSVLLQEFADAMMEVKKAVDDIKDSMTLKKVLSCLLATGNFLNGKVVSVNSIFCNAHIKVMSL